MSNSNWLIYGANGYTGELIAREAAKRGWRPILAGRNREQVGALAAELKLECRIAALDDRAAARCARATPRRWPLAGRLALAPTP